MRTGRVARSPCGKNRSTEEAGNDFDPRHTCPPPWRRPVRRGAGARVRRRCRRAGKDAPDRHRTRDAPRAELGHGSCQVGRLLFARRHRRRTYSRKLDPLGDRRAERRPGRHGQCRRRYGAATRRARTGEGQGRIVAGQGHPVHDRLEKRDRLRQRSCRQDLRRQSHRKCRSPPEHDGPSRAGRRRRKAGAGGHRRSSVARDRRPGRPGRRDLVLDRCLVRPAAEGRHQLLSRCSCRRPSSSRPRRW